MTDEKMIEEMVQDILQEFTNCYGEEDEACLIEIIRKYIPENAVVLTNEEHERLTSRRYFLKPKRKLSPVEIILAERNNPFVVVPENMDIITIPSEDEIRKETAREILKELKAKQVICSPEEDNFVYMLDIKELAKQYGVEIEE